jgi:NAD(P)-dependent dehydrogenase (short-subunit alcohol dehydrogenase family)
VAIVTGGSYGIGREIVRKLHWSALTRLRLDLGRRVEDARAVETSESIDCQSAIAVAVFV